MAPQLGLLLVLLVAPAAGLLHSERLCLNLLVQRAVQTQMHYLSELRNDFTSSWLNSFSEEHHGVHRLMHKNSARMLHFHDAMGDGTTWDDYLTSMVSAPDETHTVEVKLGCRRQGSRDNPFLQPASSTRTYQSTVRPAHLYRQIVQIRERLAEEWTNDLPLIGLDNDELRRHHREEVKNVVDEQERFVYAIRPLQYDDASGEFSSPLRQSTFDLLKNAVTDVALQQLIDEEARSGSPQQCEWIKGFTSRSAQALRAPAEQWNVAREVMRTLMTQPPSIATGPDGSTCLLDPLALSERLLELRLEVASEWAQLMPRVPDDHLQLARARLELSIADE